MKTVLQTFGLLLALALPAAAQVSDGSTPGTPASSTNLGTVVIANNTGTSPNGKTAQQLGVSPNGYLYYWNGTKWVGDFNFGYFSSGSASQMTAGNTAMRIYLGGNTNDQTSGHSSDDNEIKLSSGNPFGSGAFYSANFISTNGALSGAVAVSTNSAGQIIYEIDQHAMSVGITQDQTVYGDNPRTVMLLSDNPMYPMALAVNTQRGGIGGDYEVAALDFTNMIFGILRTIPGVFDFRNTTNIYAFKVDGPNNTVTINGTLSQLGDIQMPHATLDSNGTATTVGLALNNGGTANFKFFKSMGSGGSDSVIVLITHEAGEGMGTISHTTGGVFGTTSEGHFFEAYNHFGVGTNTPYEQFYATHFKSNFTTSAGGTNQLTITNLQGEVTLNTNQFAIAVTGWTNTNAFNCTLLITNTSANTFTYSDGTNTILTGTVVASTTVTTFPMGPGYKYTAASGLAGKVVLSH